MDAIVESLSGLSKKMALTLSGLLSTGVYDVMLYYALQMVERTLRSGQVSPAGAIPMVLVYLSLQLGFLFGALRQMLKSATPGALFPPPDEMWKREKNNHGINNSFRLASRDAGPTHLNFHSADA